MGNTFTFIADQEFRESVDNDRRELDSCVEKGAWKAAHVLAGSIVEAMLVETLISVEYKKSDPLKMMLDKVIEACEAEKIITSKTAGLTNVVREYRNLIHPGRVIRLKEPVTEAGAKIAAQLVDLIAEEVARFRQKRLGYTADQLVSKLEKDTPAATSILPHLLKQTSAHEVERLLLELIPVRHHQLTIQEDDDFGPAPATREARSALQRCFRLALETAKPQLQEKVGRRHVNVISNEDRAYVLEHCSGFFLGQDLGIVPEPDRELVVDFLLSEIENGTLPLGCFRGMAKYIPEQKVVTFVRGLLHMAVVNKEGRAEWQKVAGYEFSNLSEDGRKEATAVLDHWIKHYRDRKNDSSAQIVESLKLYADPDIPF